MGLYESIMQSSLSQSLDRVPTAQRTTSDRYESLRAFPSRPTLDESRYGSPYAPREARYREAQADPDYGVGEATPRVTKVHQYRTMSGRLNERIYVVSSNVVSMAYNSERQTLTVEFQRWVKGVGRVIGGGARYIYFDISLAEWKSAKTAGSKGKWVWAVLRRGGKSYTRVR